MAPPKSGLPDRQIRIGSESFTVRFSIKALAALQEHWGLTSFSEVGQRLGRIEASMGADDLVGILWAGLRTHHSDLDKMDVLDLIDASGMDGLIEALSGAIGAGLPDSGEGQSTSDARPPQPRRKTGRSPAS